MLRVPELLLCLRYAVVLVGGVDDTRSEVATPEACTKGEEGAGGGEGEGERRKKRSDARGEGGLREIERKRERR